MRIGKLSLALLLPSLCLTACSGTLLNTYSESALDGNWHIIGTNTMLNGSQAQSPFIGMALVVSGDTIYANGDASVVCSQSDGGVGSSIGASGPIAPDGSFLLDDTSFPSNTIQFSIQGTVPAPGAGTWQGTYKIFNAASSVGCTFNQSGDFIATRYSPFEGAYVGAISGADLGFGNGASLGSGLQVVLHVSQGAPTSTPVGRVGIPAYYIPLNGAITISGTSCFTSGTVSTGPNSSIEGDFFHMSLAMNDSSQVQLQGWFADPTETTLDRVNLAVFNGPCAGQGAGGTLTLQQ